MEVELSQKAIDAIAYKAATIVVSKLKAEDQAHSNGEYKRSCYHLRDHSCKIASDC